MSRQHLTAHLFILLLFSLAGRNSNFIKLNELNVEDREDRNLINTRSEEDAAATTFTWIFFCSINSIEGTKKKTVFCSMTFYSLSREFTGEHEWIIIYEVFEPSTSISARILRSPLYGIYYF